MIHCKHEKPISPNTCTWGETSKFQELFCDGSIKFGHSLIHVLCRNNSFSWHPCLVLKNLPSFEKPYLVCTMYNTHWLGHSWIKSPWDPDSAWGTPLFWWECTHDSSMIHPFIHPSVLGTLHPTLHLNRYPTNGQSNPGQNHVEARTMWRLHLILAGKVGWCVLRSWAGEKCREELLNVHKWLLVVYEICQCFFWALLLCHQTQFEEGFVCLYWRVT